MQKFESNKDRKYTYLSNDSAFGNVDRLQVNERQFIPSNEPVISVKENIVLFIVKV